MSISKTWVQEPKNIEKTLTLYRSPELPIMTGIAEQLGTTYHNVRWVCRHNLPPAEYEALMKVRYSRSKMGAKNPMFGKVEGQHHNWIGQVHDGHGYLTCMKDGRRQFVHRVVMAEALGLKELPEGWNPHHIDGDRQNNDPENLALVTNRGHLQLHFLQVKDSVSVMLKRSTLWDALKSLTSK